MFLHNYERCNSDMTSQFAVPIFKTIKETAKITKIAEYRVRKIVKSGRVKYLKAGNKFLINLDNFLEYLKNGDTEEVATKQEVFKKIRERRI